MGNRKSEIANNLKIINHKILIQTMIKNYFKIAWRNLMKNKVFSFINIFGLTIGLVSFLLIALYVFDELTFDRFHKKGDNIYRIIEFQTTPEGKETKIAGVPYQLAEKAKSVFLK